MRQDRWMRLDKGSLAQTLGPFRHDFASKHLHL
jgi:hypothetical protein